MFDLTGKTALVTGATGGIGGAIARSLHASGATVAVSGRQAEKLEGLASELGERVHVVPCDLGDRAAVAKLIDEAIGKTHCQSSCRGSVKIPFVTPHHCPPILR